MDPLTDDETPIYTQLCKDYDAIEEINKYLAPYFFLAYERRPLHADD